MIFFVVVAQIWNTKEKKNCTFYPVLFTVACSMRQDVFDNLLAVQSKMGASLEPEAKRFLEKLIKLGKRNGKFFPGLFFLCLQIEKDHSSGIMKNTVLHWSCRAMESPETLFY